MDEISSMLNKTSASKGITINGKTLIPDPKTGNAAIFSGATENNVFDYFKELTGRAELPPARQIDGDGLIYVIEAPKGNINLRSVSSSAQKNRRKVDY